MQKERYRAWLEQQRYDAATVTAQMYRAERVEQYHGDLDDHYARDRMASVLETLRYSNEDARRRRPNREQDSAQRLGLERDMQAALRANLESTRARPLDRR